MTKIGMIIGILISLFGVSIILTPFKTYFILGSIAGFVLLINGVPSLIVNLIRKDRKLFKIIVPAITTFLGFILVATDMAQVLTQTIIVYIIAGGIIITGLIECISSLAVIKKDKRAIETLVIGIISLILGFLCITFKETTVVIIGASVGFYILRIGLNLFVFARDYNKPYIIDSDFVDNNNNSNDNFTENNSNNNDSETKALEGHDA